jgi:Chaperone of endosialidase
MTTILIKKKDTAGAPAPGDLTNAAGGAEIAVNTATKRLYSKDSGGNVIELGTNPSGTTMAGNLLFSPDNTYDIGASGATRARTLYLGTSLITPAITNTGLTSGRVVFSTTAGLETDSANLTFSGTILTSAGFAGPLNGTVGATTPASGAFTTLSATSTANTKVLSVIASSSGDQFYVKPQAANSGVELFSRDSADSAYKPMALYGEKFTFGGNSTLATIDSSGNLGLGVTPVATWSGYKVLQAGIASFAGGSSGAYLIQDNCYTDNSGSSWKYINNNYAAAQYYAASGAHVWRTAPNNGASQAGTTATLTSAMTLDASGNLVVGDTTAAYTFSGRGNITIGGTTGSLLGFRVNSVNKAYIYHDGTSLDINNQANGFTSFSTNATERARIDSSGNLLVGTTTAVGRLTVTSAASQEYGTFDAPTSGYAFFRLRYNGTSYGNIGQGNAVVTGGAATDFGLNATTNMLFATNGNTERMRLDSSGNLGIGTTSPGAVLHTFSSAVANSIFATTRATGAYNQYSLGASGAIIGYVGAANQLATSGSVSDLSLRAENNLVFAAGGSERARIDSSGNLLVGQTTKSQTTVGTSLTADGIVSTAMAASTNTDNSYHLYSTGAGAYRFYVGLGGTINATSIVITAISDERLKENVRDIDTGLSSIMALKPRRFDWKEGKGQDKKDVAGFIAQEFEDVFPECVSTSKAGADGIEYKNINHETLIPTLVKAIQEQQALITQLTARITALETP